MEDVEEICAARERLKENNKLSVRVLHGYYTQEIQRVRDRYDRQEANLDKKIDELLKLKVERND